MVQLLVTAGRAQPALGNQDAFRVPILLTAPKIGGKRGTASASFGPMAILLISWVCASTAFCLAFLSVAARRAPRVDEQMAAECEPVLRREPGVVLHKAKPATLSAEAALASPCQVA